MTDAAWDEIADRLVRESQARVEESRKLIEAWKQTRAALKGTSDRPKRLTPTSAETEHRREPAL